MSTDHNHNLFDHADGMREECNTEACRALYESGARITRARYHSSPARPEFQATLRERLLRERRQPTHTHTMLQSVRSLFNFFQPKMLAGVVAGIVLLIGAAAVIYHQSSPAIQRLIISPAYAEDNFEVTPTAGDTLTVESTTRFIVKSKTPLTVEELRKSLTLSPEVPFRIESVSDREFTIIPERTLEPRRVYQVSIHASYALETGTTVERDYAWAFQVTDVLSVLRTLPGDKTSGVPVNTGIEVTFSSEGMTDISSAFDISPSVAGRFEQHGRTVVFVPTKPLQPQTVYTVRVKKDIPVRGATPMTEDVIIQFETAPEDAVGGTAAWGISEMQTLVEYGVNKTIALPVWVSNESVSIPVSVFAYQSSEAFTNDVLQKESIPYWASISRETFRVKTESLQKTREYSLKPERSGYGTYLIFPDTLPEGYYLIEIGSGKTRAQMFLEITPLSSFVTVTDSKTMVWVNDISTGKPVVGATIVPVGGTGAIRTGADGVATADTAAWFPSRATSSVRGQTAYLRVEQGNRMILLPVNPRDGSGMYVTNKDANQYQFHFSLDREVYQPVDDMKFWGFVAPRRGGSAPKEVTVRVIAQQPWSIFSGEQLSDNGISQVTRPLNNRGYVTGNIPLDHLTPGYYTVEIRAGEILLESKYIQIQTYTKPAYTIDLKGNKRAIFAGEPITMSVQAEFFDGTPVVKLPLQYSYGNTIDQKRGLSTDRNGRATFSVDTTYTPCTVGSTSCAWGSTGYAAQVQLEHADVSNMSAMTQYQVFSARVESATDVVLENDTVAFVSSTVYTLDLAPLNNDDYTDDARYRSGVAAGKQVTGIIHEITYIQEQTGTYYDAINKVTQPEYSYRQDKKELTRFTATTDAAGHVRYEFPRNKKKAYEVYMYVDDGEGHLAFGSQYMSASAEDIGMSNQSWYSIRETVQHPNGYAVGDRVSLALYRNDVVANVSGGRVLFYTLQNGLTSYTVSESASYAFDFQEKDIPNIFVSGIYFDGKTYRGVAEGWYRTMIRFNPESRRLTVTVKPHKTQYAPGEKATFNIFVTNRANAPESATVNVRLIDEAFYAGTQSGYTQDPLFNLYRPIEAGERSTYVTHRFSDISGLVTGAEGGGCFLPGTKILMADGSEKNIEDIRVGDRIQTFESEKSNRLVTAQVLNTEEHVVTEYLSINGSLRVTPEHRVLVNGVWKTAGDIRIGDMLRGEGGVQISVVSIDRVRALVTVYNFHVEHFHTYIADGIYVHNDKGGGRSLFPDVALYTTVTTGVDGRATVAVTLPDSITSWRLTAEAVGARGTGGMTTARVPVSLPFFAQTILPKTLVAGDAPIASVRAYGTALHDSTSVTGTVQSSVLSAPIAITGQAYSTVAVPLGTLPAGMFQVTTTLQSGSYRDTLVQSYMVLPSRVTKTVERITSLRTTSTLPGSAIGLTKITIMDAGRGGLYSAMTRLTCDCGARIDMRIGRTVGEKMSETYFGQKIETPSSIDFGQYQDSQNGGIRLLPYTSADVETSAALAAVASDEFDTMALRNYLYGFVQSADGKKLTRQEAAAALMGLAALREPVLPAVISLSKQSDLTTEQQLYIAFAFAYVGDTEHARQIYRTTIAEHGEDLGEMARVNIGKTSDDARYYTAKMAALGALIGDPAASRFAAYVAHEPMNQLVTFIDELIYLRSMLARVSGTPVSLTLRVGGEDRQIALKPGETHTITVTPRDLASLTWSNVQGDAVAVSVFDEPRIARDTTLTNLFSVRRWYVVNGKETTTIREGDMVEVHIRPTITKKAMSGSYDIVDVLPSGLRFVPNTGYETPSTCSFAAPYEVNEQVLKFSFTPSQQQSCTDIVYTARVASLGMYRVEPVMMQATDNVSLVASDGREWVMTILP